LTARSGEWAAPALYFIHPFHPSHIGTECDEHFFTQDCIALQNDEDARQTGIFKAWRESDTRYPLRR